jgi:hypothetical protein
MLYKGAELRRMIGSTHRTAYLLTKKRVPISENKYYSRILNLFIIEHSYYSKHAVLIRTINDNDNDKDNEIEHKSKKATVKR